MENPKIVCKDDGCNENAVRVMNEQTAAACGWLNK